MQIYTDALDGFFDFHEVSEADVNFELYDRYLKSCDLRTAIVYYFDHRGVPYPGSTVNPVPEFPYIWKDRKIKCKFVFVNPFLNGRAEITVNGNEYVVEGDTHPDIMDRLVLICKTDPLYMATDDEHTKRDIRRIVLATHPIYEECKDDLIPRLKRLNHDVQVNLGAKVMRLRYKR